MICHAFSSFSPFCAAGTHTAADVFKLVVRNAMAIFTLYVTEFFLSHIFGVSVDPGSQSQMGALSAKSP